MAGASAQDPTPADATHLVLYDGVCGLCSRLVQFLLTRDHRAVFAFATLQGATGLAMVRRFGGDPRDLTTFYVVADYRTSRARMLNRSNAALFVAGTLGWPWKAAVALRVVPAVIRDWAYGVIGRHRYRMFGRYEQCLMPPPEFRGRFVDPS